MQLDEVKIAMVNRSTVICNGSEYTIHACRMRLHKGTWVYDLELLDKNRNSIVVVDMRKVDIK